MEKIWGLTGYLPLILYGLLLYSLFVSLPRWIRSKRSGAGRRDESSPRLALADAQRRLSRTAPTRIEDAPGYPRAPSRPAAEAGWASAETPTSAVSEAVSVILRRQMPPRLDAPARSWLGGLPCLPDATPWPRSVSSEHPERGERPLHFVAQICCADLPRELWGGLGPRTGWLLLFVDPNQGCPEGNDAFRVMHFVEPGSERAAPPDLGPVHDGVFDGPSYDHLPPSDPVPDRWRRWPVNLVVAPNEARQEHGRVLVAPENYASILYEGAEIAEEKARPADAAPFTNGQARYALFDLRRASMQTICDVQLSPAFRAELRRDETIPVLVAHGRAEARRLREERERLSPSSGAAPPEQDEWRRARIGHFERREQWLLEMRTADAIIDYLEASPALERAWQEELLAPLEAMIEAIGRRDPDSPLSEEEWRALAATLADRRFTRWRNEHEREIEGRPRIAFFEHARTGEAPPPRRMHQLTADLYVDARRRPLIPKEVVAQYEPHWRRLLDNRPHRMGGYHDGLQSDAVIGPAEELLLFQIASDDAMNWWWGDVGAYYFWIRPNDLAAGDFSRVRMDLECY